MVASGNDFVIIDKSHEPRAISYERLAKKICNRKFGVGADGLLILEKSKVVDAKMRIFNADGSEAEMCGNGARCAASYLSSRLSALSLKQKLRIEAMAGIIDAQVKADNIKVRLTDPKGLKIDLPIKVNNRKLIVNFINTGVPHTVIFAEGLNKIDVFNLGRQIRYHQRFAPAGTNVDFIEVINNNSLKIRTYERGVEDETLACGTGAVAAALVASLKLPTLSLKQFNVLTKSGEVLKVYFYRIRNSFTDVWLEGKVKIVYKGEYYV